MTEVLTAFASKGGPLGAIALVLFAAKFLWDAKRQRGSDKTTSATASTNDLATANSLLLAQLATANTENVDLRNELDDARAERDRLADQLIDTKRDYEAQLDVLRRKVADITQQLDALTARLQSDPPLPH